MENSMKKKLLISAMAATLAVGVAFSSMACNASVSSFLNPPSYQLSTKKLSLENDVEFSTPDSTGLMIVKNKIDSYNNYRLFDVNTNTFINGASITESSYTTSETMERISDGFYYTSLTRYDASSNTNVTTYNLYDKNGLAASNLTGQKSGSLFITENGTKYYLGVDKTIKNTSNPLERIFSNYNVQKWNNLYLVSSPAGFEAYDSKLNLKYSLSANDFELPIEHEVFGEWFIGNYIFMQYGVQLPDDADTYDLFNESSKWDLETIRVNLSNGKVKKFNFNDYIVNSCKSHGEKGAILSVQKITNKLIIESSNLIGINSKCDVTADFSELAPEANSIAHQYGDYLILKSHSRTFTLKGRKVVNTINNTSLNYVNNTAYLESGNKFYFYDLEGNFKYSYDCLSAPQRTFKGNLVFKTKDSVYEYDTISNSSNKILSYGKNVDIQIDSYCVKTSHNTGSEKLYNYHFLVDGISNINNVTNTTKIVYSPYNMTNNNNDYIEGCLITISHKNQSYNTTNQEVYNVTKTKSYDYDSPVL